MSTCGYGSAPSHRRSLRRLLQRLTVRRSEGFHEGVRQMIRGHLDEIAVEAREQLPVLRLVGGARLAAPRGALEARFELGRIESIEKFDERGARRLRHGALVKARRGNRIAQPLHRVEAASLVPQQQLHRQVLDYGVLERGTRIILLGRRRLDAIAVARLDAGALELLESHERLTEKPARQMQQPTLRLRRQPFGGDAGTAAEGVEAG